MFYELESYTFDVFAKCEEERTKKLNEFFESNSDTIMAIIEKMKTKQYYPNPKLDDKNELPKDK